jgi:hypothetical protein
VSSLLLLFRILVVVALKMPGVSSTACDVLVGVSFILFLLQKSAMGHARFSIEAAELIGAQSGSTGR